MPADRVPRDPPWGGPGRGLPPRGGAGRGPGAVGPPQDPQADANPALRERVVDLLEDRVSPRQIAARLRFENPDDESMRICHEQIYQALYVQGAGSLRAQLRVEKALRTGRTRRTPALPAGRTAQAQGQEPDTGAPPSVCARPRGDEGAVPGHWEGDLVIGAGGRSALITLVERTSRFVLISRLGTCHDSATVTDALQTMVADLPRAVRASITWDQGSEMAQHAGFTAVTGIPVYFADPHSPRSASHQREHRRTDPRVLPQGHQLHRRHRRPGPGRPGPPQPPTPPGLERTDPS